MRDWLAFRAWSYTPSYEDGEQGEKQKILKLKRRLNLGFKESGMQDEDSSSHYWDFMDAFEQDRGPRKT